MVELATRSSGVTLQNSFFSTLTLFSCKATLKMCLKAFMESVKFGDQFKSKMGAKTASASATTSLSVISVHVLARIQPQSRAEIVSTEALPVKRFLSQNQKDAQFAQNYSLFKSCKFMVSFYPKIQCLGSISKGIHSRRVLSMLNEL